jgi:hypothetical protein
MRARCRTPSPMAARSDPSPVCASAVGEGLGEGRVERHFAHQPKPATTCHPKRAGAKRSQTRHSLFPSVSSAFSVAGHPPVRATPRNAAQQNPTFPPLSAKRTHLSPPSPHVCQISKRTQSQCQPGTPLLFSRLPSRLRGPPTAVLVFPPPSWTIAPTPADERLWPASRSHTR